MKVGIIGASFARAAYLPALAHVPGAEVVAIASGRLESARSLLGSPGSSIKRVAQQCGYEDEGSFRRAFNRFSGMTPAAYRDWADKRQG